MLLRRAPWLFVGLALACSKPLPPPPPPPKLAGPPSRDVGPLVPLGYGEDRVGPVDSPVRADGDPDFALRVRLSGDVRALVLYSSDATGEPSGGDVWDTLTGTEKFPPNSHLQARADQSWAIAVLDGKGALLNPNVALDKRVFDDEIVTILAPDPGHRSFVSGRTYSLLVIRDDGKTDRATTTLL